ncbi:DUF6982 domain-containing protein [Acidipila rosea]|uniref:Uncharacterized protein n=1 Tax=Acidipila rosea TaxID=768535 RepID=A0A4R1KXW7_9BACT|nr:hypothetical protein [Acidipila rosea]TCK70214.1 hypothetical protein C7378_3369 [Acidipila rosea]
MPTSRKKIVARMLNQEWLAGYLSSSLWADGDQLEVLSLDGKILPVFYAQLKWLCFVRDFNSGEIENPERLLRKSFAGRPRGRGLWLRLTLKDGDVVEGLAENDLTLVTPPGIFLTPPDLRSNTQRIWIPRSSITAFEVVALLGSSQRAGAGAAKMPPLLPSQEQLFPDEHSGLGKIQSSL